MNLSPLSKIALVGMMGVGKTTIARLLAKKLGWVFVDTDDEIEAIEGKDVSKIFALHGESYFRRCELDVVNLLLKNSDQAIIATGGGAYINDEIRLLLHRYSYVIWLKNDNIVTLYDRASINRPLVSNLEKFADLYNLRKPKYEYADLVVDIEHMDLENIVLHILELINLKQ